LNKISGTILNKKKIINDPVYGFITLHSELIYDIIDHPYFQRLRRIKQLGLTDLVYPGAHHTRFHHALGAMHLMSMALDNLRGKGTNITPEEYEGALLAILLHDIGHGPFSHALEYSLMEGIKHEQISLSIMEVLNKNFEGKLSLAIDIFKGSYRKKFLHQLVSSQLDMDRLDYLRRDSFYTGVLEGTIGSDRIIKLLNVKDGELIVEEKGIYSIEHFLGARRIMYWQVYLHKTSVCAENMIVLLIKRARNLRLKGIELGVSNSLDFFLKNQLETDEISTNKDVLHQYCLLDDYDIWSAIKAWQWHEDLILSKLSNMILNRKLFKIKIQQEPFEQEWVDLLKEKVKLAYALNEEEVSFFFAQGDISNAAYLPEKEQIHILNKKGKIIDVASATDLPNIKAMSKIVTKHFLCWPKGVSL
jgi:uncharacterized protein